MADETHLERLRRLHEAATPEPWTHQPDGMVVLSSGQSLTYGVWNMENYALVVAARNALPKLLDLADAVVDAQAQGFDGTTIPSWEGSSALFAALQALEEPDA